jgi:hypothetical protein
MRFELTNSTLARTIHNRMAEEFLSQLDVKRRSQTVGRNVGERDLAGAKLTLQQPVRVGYGVSSANSITDGAYKAIHYAGTRPTTRSYGAHRQQLLRNRFRLDC